MQRITAPQLMRGLDCVRIGEITYFPWFNLIGGVESRVLGQRLEKVEWFWRMLRKREPEFKGSSRTHLRAELRRSLTFAPFLLENWYRHWDRRFPESPEPAWALQYMDRKTLRVARARWMAVEGFGDRLFSLYGPLIDFVPPPYWIPFSGIGYGFCQNGLLHACFEGLNLHRIEQIHQLGWLRDPFAEETDGDGVGHQFNHKRYPHVTDAAAIAQLLCHNCADELSDDVIRHIVAAAATHDAATPAGGDTAKLADSRGLDEDRRYPELLTSKNAKQFLKSQRLSAELLAQIVQGDHPIGSALLDIADKIAYVSRDFTMALYSGNYVVKGGAPYPPKHQELLAFIRTHRLFTSVWDAVALKHQQVYFRAPQRLFRFLVGRALMFANIYHNPNSRGFDHTALASILRYLYAAGDISSADLIAGTDEKLVKLVRTRTGFFHQERAFDRTPNPLRETFADEVKAKERERELVQQGYAVILEDLRSATSDGTRLLVAKGDEILPFSDAHPEETAQVKQCFTRTHAIRLYAVPIKDLNLKPEFAARLCSFERERVQLQEKGA